MELTSNAFDAGGSIPQSYTCDGENIPPPLTWSGVPDVAHSLALMLEDPDAPRGTFTHWVLYSMPPDQTELETILRSGIMQGQNDYGDTEYVGPCPPRGSEHRYFFRLYALDQEPDLAPGATRQQFLNAIQGHILSQAELMGRYARG